MMPLPTSDQVVALCGGVGGSKLALGLYRALGPDRLTLVVNTGDDFENHGLNISPDIDTVVYTLAGLADAERGWGRAGESWQFMAALRDLNDDAWFNLGDRDLAMHVLRTAWLRDGGLLSTFTADIGERLGIRARILPMTDSAVRTVVRTDEGDLAFQDYFVRRRCAPAVHAIHFDGADLAQPVAGLLDILAQPVRAIVICPSNPYLSIDPILAVPQLVDALKHARAPVIAVSPLVGGQAVKGPTAKLMAELGIAIATKSIAAHYRGLIDGLVIDGMDAADRMQLDLPVFATNTMMRNLEDRERLARDVLGFCAGLTGQTRAKVPSAEGR